MTGVMTNVMTGVMTNVMTNVMTGVLTTRKGERLAFRREDGMWWLWPVHSDYTRGETHKVYQFPAGTVEVFDVESPPRTVSFLPILTSY